MEPPITTATACPTPANNRVAMSSPGTGGRHAQTVCAGKLRAVSRSRRQLAAGAPIPCIPCRRWRRSGNASTTVDEFNGDGFNRLFELNGDEPAAFYRSRISPRAESSARGSGKAINCFVVRATNLMNRNSANSAHPSSRFPVAGVKRHPDRKANAMEWAKWPRATN